VAKVDTVGKNYYDPLKHSELAGDTLFWIVSLLSVAALFIDKNAHPAMADTVQVTLIVLVILFFVQGQFQRLHLFPRAEDRRRQQLLSDSFGVTLTHEQTDGYYNNEQTHPIKRLAANVMESAFFTREISKMMLPVQRATSIGYIVIYLIAALNRSTDLGFLAIAAQALFGGEVLGRWLRLEWLHRRSEQAFDNFNRLFTARPPFTKPRAQSEALDLFSFYETTKATAAMLVSSRLFHKHNAKLTQQWEQIRSRLGL